MTSLNRKLSLIITLTITFFVYSDVVFAAGVLPNACAKNRTDITEKMKDSIVYLQISYGGYEQYQPWKNKEITEGWSVGCAVAGNQVITTASNVVNAAVIKIKRFGQNEFVPAEIKIIDYESNLALIELDPNA